jgi:hypothetical protein
MAGGGAGRSAGTGGTGGSAAALAGRGGDGAGRGAAGGTPGGAGGASAQAGTGGAGQAAASGCEGSDYALCEDFETTDEGDVPEGWTQSGDASVDAEHKYRGEHSLRVAPEATGQRRIRHDLAQLGDTSGIHWGRIFYRVTPQPVPDEDVVHATFVALHGDSPNHDDQIEVRVVDTVANVTGRHQFLFNVEPDGARGEFGYGSDYDWMFDGEWHCAEWRVAFDTQSYRFFIDSEEVADIAQENGAGNYEGTELPMTFDTIAVGINNYQDAAFGGSEGYEMWIDDVALDDDRIGCE